LFILPEKHETIEGRYEDISDWNEKKW
jgi:hypothetical protein